MGKPAIAAYTLDTHTHTHTCTVAHTHRATHRHACTVAHTHCATHRVTAALYLSNLRSCMASTSTIQRYARRGHKDIHINGHQSDMLSEHTVRNDAHTQKHAL